MNMLHAQSANMSPIIDLLLQKEVAKQRREGQDVLLPITVVVNNIHEWNKLPESETSIQIPLDNSEYSITARASVSRIEFLSRQVFIESIKLARDIRVCR